MAGTFLLATPAVPYARLSFAEPLSGLLLLSGFLLLWVTGPRDREAAVRAGEAPIPAWALPLSGLCLGLAVLVKPANAIYVPVPELYLTWALIWRVRRVGGVEPDSFRPPALRRAVAGLALFAAGLAPGLLLTGLYNFARYHNVFIFGYEQEGFTTPLALGLYGLLASPGKGIIFFAPPVLLAPFALRAMWRQGGRFLHAEAACIAAQAAITLVFHALWSSWEGNIAWGPRLILPLVPLLLWPLGALAGSLRARRAWAALAGLGSWSRCPARWSISITISMSMACTARGRPPRRACCSRRSGRRSWRNGVSS